MRETEDRRNSGRVVAGLVIVAIGVVMFLDRTGLADISVHLSGRFWPFIPIALGLARMSESPRRSGDRRALRSGAWLLWVGAWGLVSEFHVLGLDYQTSWPLLVIGAGIGVVWRAVAESHGAEQPLKGN